MFALHRAHRHICAQGALRHLNVDSVDDLEGGCLAFFRALADGDGPAMLAGLLPFDTGRPICLRQPESVRRGTGTGPLGGVGPLDRGWAPTSIEMRPEPAEYARMVDLALRRIAAGDIEKVVLARSLRIETGVAVDPFAITARLVRDARVTTFIAPLGDGAGPVPSVLVGATPELLVSRTGQRVESHPLAGSAARRIDPVEDEAAAAALLRSDKDRREHALVVEAILDILSPVCANLHMPEGVALHATATMWHLGTRIEGTLRPDAPGAAGLAALLHPTPAVGGFPRQPALDLIRELEPHDRGYYAGAVGWTDAQGDGEWHVSLRCAEIRGTMMTLHAGAGIVAGSDADAEVAETAAKFRAMLQALDLEGKERVLEAIA